MLQEQQKISGWNVTWPLVSHSWIKLFEFLFRILTFFQKLSFLTEYETGFDVNWNVSTCTVAQ